MEQKENNMRILVLMSVYNGQEYLREQIDSILGQEGVNIHLLVRDDGSKDDSVSILNDYASKDKRVEVVAEQNLGCLGSFNALVDMACARKEYDYFAFSDQDDVWLPHKLESGILSLSECDDEEKQLPQMYFCNMMIADGEAKPLFPLWKYPLKMKRANMLKTNKAAGCTIVFNRTMAEMYNQRPAVAPSLHDTWMMFIALFFGKVYYDHECHIYYRQHLRNVVGMHGLVSGKTRWKQRYNAYFHNKGSKECEIVRQFRETFFDDLTEQDRQLMKIFAEYHNNWKCKLKLLINNDFYPDTPPEKYLTKHINYALKILFGKL